MTKKEFPKRGDIYVVSLDPTTGSEINKTRPCLVVSPNIANEESWRVIIAPITSNAKVVYPFQVKVTIAEIEGRILLDQLRSVDKIRLKKRIKAIDEATMKLVDKALKIALGLS